VDAKRNNPVAEAADREIISTRVIAAPRDLVFKAFSDPENLARWWGPKGFTNTFHEFDLRPGGAWRFVMHGPDGVDYPNESVFVEVVKPERIVFVNSFSDEKGNVARHSMHMAWPLEILNTIGFTEQAGKTTVTVRSQPLNATEEERKTFEDGFESRQQGWGGTLDKLAEYLAKV